MAPCNVSPVLHGAIVLLLGHGAGYASFRAIALSPQDTTKIGMWRMSHSATSMGAVFLIALGPVVPHLSMSPPLAGFLVTTLIASTYALCLGTVAASVSGH